MVVSHKSIWDTMKEKSEIQLTWRKLCPVFDAIM